MSGPPAAGPAPAIGSERQLGYTAIVLGGPLLAAANAMISTTITPTTVLDIGGIALVSWATTLYEVASIVAAAAGGLLLARAGLRLAVTAGPAVFTLGGLVCALAPTMPVLLAGRLIQGAGAGLALALAYAAIRILFPEARWNRLFALISVVWAVAALSGPLLGAGLIALLSWRLAYLTMALLGLVLALAALVSLPRRGADPEASQRVPLLWLTLLGLAILAIASAASVSGLAARLACLGGGTALAAVLVWIDRRRADGLLPSDAFAWSTPVGLGLWMILAMFAGGMPFAIFGPLVLQVLHGQPPLVAGYMLAIEALSWSVVALAIAPLPRRYWDHALIAGPVLIAASLVGIAMVLPQGSLAWIAFWTAVLGAGYGVCWAFLGQRIMACARPGEGGRAAASIATMEVTGLALGAALAGVMGSMLGLGVAPEAVSLPAIAGIGHLAFLPIMLLLILAAVRLVRRSPPPAGHASAPGG